MNLFKRVSQNNLSNKLLDTCIRSADFLIDFPALKIFLKSTKAPNPILAMKFEAMLLTYGIILNQMHQKLGNQGFNRFQDEIWEKFRSYVLSHDLTEGLSSDFDDFCNNRFELNHKQIEKFFHSTVGTYVPRKMLCNIFEKPLNTVGGESKNIEIDKYFSTKLHGVLDIIIDDINKAL